MPTNADLERRRIAAVPRGVSVSLPICAAHALNAELTDIEGRRYIDFGSGIAVLNTGHLHPKVKAAVTRNSSCFPTPAFRLPLMRDMFGLQSV